MELTDNKRTSAMRNVKSQFSSVITGNETNRPGISGNEEIYSLIMGNDPVITRNKAIHVPFSIILLFLLLFNGCKKEDEMDNLTADSFNGSITANVENGASYNSQIRIVWVLFDSQINNGYLTGIKVTEGQYANGGFSVSMPDIPDQYLTNVKTFFSNVLNVNGDLDYSNSDARMLYVDFWGMDSDLGYIDYFTYTNTGSKRTTCFFVYSDSEVTVKGGKNIGVMLRKGWNRIYRSSDKLTSKAPDDMKWYLNGKF